LEGQRFRSTILVSGVIVFIDHVTILLQRLTCSVLVGPDTVQFILQHTGTRAVLCARRNLPQLCEAKTTNNCPHFRVAILVDGVTPDANRQASACGLEVVSLSKVEAVGSEVLATTGHKHSPPTYDDVATFSYTSGTTGTPKGALLTHGNMVSAMAGYSIFGDMVFCLTDRHLSYLPLPHIFERCVMSQILTAGASAAFFRGDPTLLIEDLQACRPTILPAAPRVLNKIYDKVRHVGRKHFEGVSQLSLAVKYV
jgi:long-chain acyl-CoA synthetase